VCIIKSLRPVDLVPVFSQIVTGTHTNNKCISYFQTKSLRISPLSDDKNFIIDYDGEAGGKMPAEISVVPRGLGLVVPKNSEKTKKLFI
jgi:diacylglycerol kinase (ATP)